MFLLLTLNIFHVFFLFLDYWLWSIKGWLEAHIHQGPQGACAIVARFYWYRSRHERVNCHFCRNDAALSTAVCVFRKLARENDKKKNAVSNKVYQFLPYPRTTKFIRTSSPEIRWKIRGLKDSFCHKTWTRKDIRIIFVANGGKFIRLTSSKR